MVIGQEEGDGCQRGETRKKVRDRARFDVAREQGGEGGTLIGAHLSDTGHVELVPRCRSTTRPTTEKIIGRRPNYEIILSWPTENPRRRCPGVGPDERDLMVSGTNGIARLSSNSTKVQWVWEEISPAWWSVLQLSRNFGFRFNRNRITELFETCTFQRNFLGQRSSRHKRPNGENKCFGK